MPMQNKSFDEPDTTRSFPKGKVELVKLGLISFGLSTFEPGWRWSESVKPLAKTASCQALHTIYHMSGRLHVRLDDGTEKEYGPGDVYMIPPGHDAWTVGDEPAVGLDISV